ncbi:MAG: hypothetical protein QXF12_00370 [Candidatus Aenigmatarchaeota archaeon]
MAITKTKGVSIKSVWEYIYNSLKAHKIETVLGIEKFTFWQPVNKSKSIKNKMFIIDYKMNKQFIFTIISLMDIKNKNKTVAGKVIQNVLKFIKRKYPNIIKPLGASNDRLKNMASYYGFRFLNGFAFTFMTLLFDISMDLSDFNAKKIKETVKDEDKKHYIWGILDKIKEVKYNNKNNYIDTYIVDSDIIPFSMNELNSFCNIYVLRGFDDNDSTLINKVCVLEISNKEGMDNYLNVAKTIMRFFNYMSLVLSGVDERDEIIDYVRYYSRINASRSHLEKIYYRVVSDEENNFNMALKNYAYGTGTYNQIIDKTFNEVLTDNDYTDTIIDVLELIVEEANNYCAKNKIKINFRLDSYKTTDPNNNEEIDSMVLYSVHID